jgi:hypothetical protein
MSEAPEVHTVWIQIKPPTATKLAVLAYGFYTVSDGVVTMVDPKGALAVDESGNTYKHKLAQGEDAKTVAARLTRKLRLALQGKSEAPTGFRGPIAYPKIGTA